MQNKRLESKGLRTLDNLVGDEWKGASIYTARVMKEMGNR